MSKEILTSTVWGIAPWSDELLRVSGDVSRGRATDEDFVEQLETDRSIYQGALLAAGIDYKPRDYGGTLDYLRQTVKGSTGFAPNIDTAPVTRWFDTNTFYRKPTISGPLEYDATELANILLTPTAFAALCDRGPGISKKLALDYVTELYGQIFATLGNANGKTPILLHDPLLAYEGSENEDIVRVTKTLSELASANPDLDLGVYFSGGDGERAVTHLVESDIPIAQIGCDLTKTSATSLPSLGERTLLAGLVDAKNTANQSDVIIYEALEEAYHQTEPAEISLTHTVDLEHLPRAYALEKINQIGRIANESKIGTIK